MGRAMKDSGIEWIGQAPDSWECYTLSQLATQVKNKNTGMAENNLLSLSYGKIKKRSINAVGGLLPESFEGYNIIEPDDIVLRLTDLQNDQTSLRVGISTQRGIVTSAYLTIRLTSADYPKYIYYYLHTFDVCKGLYGMGAGVRQGLNWDGMKRLPILLPDIEEQHRIAEYLDSLLDKIDVLLSQTRTSIEEYKRLKQSVITRAVTKGVRGDRPMKESGIEWIGEIPSEWKINKVVRIFSLISSGTTPRTTDEASFDGEINWIQSGDINGAVLSESKNQISKSTLEKYSTLKIYKAPYIILAMYGASVGNLSISTIDACVNQACCVLCYPDIDFQFAFYSLKSAKDYLIQKAQGGGQPNISQNIIKQLWLPVPPPDEQTEIAAYLDQKCADIDALIAKKEQLLSELESYKRSLIYEYVTGKKEISEI